MNGADVVILGVGYVGLPLALAFARSGRRVVAYDSDAARAGDLQRGVDRNDPEGGRFEVPDGLLFSAEETAIRGAGAYVIAVPTPIDADRRPDFGPLEQAADLIGRVLSPGALVVVESTVHPGATEEIVGPRVAAGGWTQGRDFQLGYSPERMNPGDARHGLADVVKVVSAENPKALERMMALYAPVIPAGLHAAPSIRVAEAAKITENIQRDVNIALMNELALVYDRLGLRTEDVLAAARTKWNFAPFGPGLVGGHCIGVDPYYLIAKAEAHGYYPELIRAARRLNDGMADRIAQKVVTLLSKAGVAILGARVGVMGVAFKANVSDARNSQVPPIVAALGALGAELRIADPLVDPALVRANLGIELLEVGALRDLDALVLASPHDVFLAEGPALAERVRSGGLIVDVRSVLDPASLPTDRYYWSL
ncbi:MAG: nucleotide sugar dehydrogenase [Alphaproteobacteria bacterium]|nr:nucleotide sugar dehydrogenase [Alphaproteobacteria bacterium]